MRATQTGRAPQLRANRPRQFGRTNSVVSVTRKPMTELTERPNGRPAMTAWHAAARPSACCSAACSLDAIGMVRRSMMLAAGRLGESE